MTDKTNARAELDAALEAMRDRAANADRITLAATVACAEALSLLVDAHLPHLLASEPEAEPEPEADPRESLPDTTHVGHGWVVERGDRRLYKPNGNGCFTWWLDKSGEWGGPGNWRESDLANTRPATVGDLRRVGVPVSEWPDVTAPEPEPELDGSVVLVDGGAWQRIGDYWHVVGVEGSLNWAKLSQCGEPTVIYTPEEVS